MKEFLDKLRELQGNGGRNLLVLSIGSYVPTGDGVSEARKKAINIQICPEFVKQAASLGINVIVLNIDPSFNTTLEPLDKSLTTKNLTIFKYSLRSWELRPYIVAAILGYLETSKDNRLIVAIFTSPMIGLILAKHQKIVQVIPSDEKPRTKLQEVTIANPLSLS